MTNYPEGEFLLSLFPLPNLVFFPNTRIPVHIFEPRYRQMITDALAAEKRIGMILLKEGWESEYYGAPVVYPYGTLATIEQAVRLEDGRFNLLLTGEVRFRIVEEVGAVPYRIARVVAEPERHGSPEEAYAQREWLAELSRLYLDFLPGESEVPEIDTANLDSLTNALVMSLNLDVKQKQELLETGDMIARAEMVGKVLQERLETLRFLAPFRKELDPSRN